jgi:DNA (cytosine-5)-methyltransferase 1
VAKLKPKVVIAENVVGLVKGNAKGYVNQIVQRFKELGYDVQLFSLNSAYMDVPQARHRVFFVANNQKYPKLKLSFNYDPVPFGKVRSEKGVPFKSEDALLNKLVKEAGPADKDLREVADRIAGEKNRYFTTKILHDHLVAPTITASGSLLRFYDKMLMSKQDFVNVGSFPQDYDFCGNDPQYVTGMSVPPNMMANIAQEVYNQWLRQ